MFVQKSSFKRCLATTRVNEKQFVRKKVSRFLDDSQLLRSSDLHLLNFSVTKYHKLSNGHKNTSRLQFSLYAGVHYSSSKLVKSIK